MPDPKAVNSMFARIASRYDLANHLLSGGIDHLWRQRLVRKVHDCHPDTVLDLATGSGDVAFALAEALPLGAQVTGMDFCQPMLDEAVKKRSNRSRCSFIEFKQGDGMALPIKDASYDAVTISFGLRNMADRHKSLSEMRRVLRPNGQLFVLEFSQPYFWFKPIYYIYLKLLLPGVAALVTGDRSAYEYLGGSIESFPGRGKMSAEISRAGFHNVRATPFTFGIVALHEAEA
jgi:demethylmenaquinone methyltransferase/2-methoxy-6-polyprenyl-1,4-benzoquinol methylase